MSRSYPIWNKVQACIYKSFTGWGTKNTGEVEIFVGSSAKNSHSFVEHKITRREKVWRGQEVIVFSFSVDNKVIKRTVFSKDKRGNAKEKLKVFSKLNRIKSLELK
mgnify:FL=1